MRCRPQGAGSRRHGRSGHHAFSLAVCPPSHMTAHQPPPCGSSSADTCAGMAAAGVARLLRRRRPALAGPALPGVLAAAFALAALLLPRRLTTPPVEPGVAAAAFLPPLAAPALAGVRAARAALAGVRPGVPVLPVLTAWVGGAPGASGRLVQWLPTACCTPAGQGHTHCARALQQGPSLPPRRGSRTWITLPPSQVKRTSSPACTPLSRANARQPPWMSARSWPPWRRAASQARGPECVSQAEGSRHTPGVVWEPLPAPGAEMQARCLPMPVRPTCILCVIFTANRWPCAFCSS